MREADGRGVLFELAFCGEGAGCSRGGGTGVWRRGRGGPGVIRGGAGGEGRGGPGVIRGGAGGEGGGEGQE